MNNFLIKWGVNIITLFAVIHVIAGVSASNWESVVITALILGLFNAFLKPFIILFTLPFTIITLGFFMLLINAFLFFLASKFVPGFEVVNFWSAFWASLLFSVISSLLNFILAPKVTLKFGSYRRGRNYYEKGGDDVIDVEGEVVERDGEYKKIGGENE